MGMEIKTGTASRALFANIGSVLGKREGERTWSFFPDVD